MNYLEYQIIHPLVEIEGGIFRFSCCSEEEFNNSKKILPEAVLGEDLGKGKHLIFLDKLSVGEVRQVLTAKGLRCES